MLKKLKIFIYCSCFIFLGLSSVFAVREDLSFYGPENRGYSGIHTLRFEKSENGLSNTYFTIDNHPNVSPKRRNFDENTAYSFVPSEGERRLLPSHWNNRVKLNISVFAIANLTLESYQNAGMRGGPSVTLNPFYESCSNNAFYGRTGLKGGEGEINFCFSQGFTLARIFDIVAHEVGHALLDVLQPGYHRYTKNHPVRAFGEAFGDLSAFFASVRMASLLGKNRDIASMIREEKDVCFAPGFLGKGTCLSRKNGDDPCEEHRNSDSFRRFFLRSMNKELERGKKSGEAVVQYFQNLLMRSVIKVPDFKNLYEFGEKMVGFVESSTLSRSMRKELKKLKKDLSRCRVSGA